MSGWHSLDGVKSHRLFNSAVFCNSTSHHVIHNTSYMSKFHLTPVKLGLTGISSNLVNKIAAKNEHTFNQIQTS